MPHESLLDVFRDEAKDLLSRSEEIFIKINSSDNLINELDESCRIFHNIKGSAKTIGLDNVSTFSHLFEELLIKLKNKEIEINSEIADCLLSSNDLILQAIHGNEHVKELNKTAAQINQLIGITDADELFEDTSSQENTTSTNTQKLNNLEADSILKVPLSRVDNIMNLLNELRILTSQYSVSKDLNPREKESSMRNINKLITQLHNNAINLRLLSANPLLLRMERVFNESLKATGKSAKFISMGGENEVDKSILDGLIDPLTHMIRNAVDHGLEDDESDRILMGKMDEAEVHLKLKKQANSFIIEISDNGKGIDAESIYLKAIEKDLIESNAHLTDQDKLQLIFKPGFSTKEQVTDISGRGVGMDVVQSLLKKLNGKCTINSIVGEGTTFTIEIPMNLSLVKGTIVNSKKRKYAIINSEIDEAQSIKTSHIVKVANNKTLLKRGDDSISIIPIDFIEGEDSNTVFDKKVALIATYNNKKYALCFDNLLGQESILVKPLVDNISTIELISGTTILPNGDVTTVIDPQKIIEKYIEASA